jgi:hypothetical protein
MDKFGPELLVIQFGFLVILSTLFLWLWFSNRRKYHNLKHAIPANVVKNYLDSIIQNSTSLKSSLFRGGGLETDSVPSVMPLTNLMGGEGLGVSGAPSTALLEEINQKKAIIASLEAQLASLQGSQREIESKLSNSERDLSSAEIKIKELEALLAQSKDADNVDVALKSELTMVTKERDEIRDRLKEFEIISDDLANLKRLQQENEQLKRSLAAQGNAPAAAAVEEDEVAFNQADVSDLLEDLGQSEIGSADNSALEDFLSSPDEVSASEPEVAAEANASNSNKPKSEKTPEDLLSEFEKMLG